MQIFLLGCLRHRVICQDEAWTLQVLGALLPGRRLPVSHIQGRGRTCYAAADASRTGLPGRERAVRLTNDLRVIGVTGRHRRHRSWSLAVIVASDHRAPSEPSSQRVAGRHQSRHQSRSPAVIRAGRRASSELVTEGRRVRGTVGSCAGRVG